MSSSKRLQSCATAFPQADAEIRRGSRRDDQRKWQIVRVAILARSES
jgi:hypothetical protein